MKMTKEESKEFIRGKFITLHGKHEQVVNKLKNLGLYPLGGWPDSNLIKDIFISRDFSLRLLLIVESPWSVSFLPPLSEESFLSIEIIDDFKTGDFITSKNDSHCVLIYHSKYDKAVVSLVDYSMGKLYINKYPQTGMGYTHGYRASTHSEKDFLLRKMCCSGYGWDEDKKEVFNLNENHCGYVSSILYNLSILYVNYIHLLPFGVHHFDDTKKERIWNEINSDYEKITNLYDLLKPTYVVTGPIAITKGSKI